MRLDSARGLKQELLLTHAAPLLEPRPIFARSFALGATSMDNLPDVIPSVALGVCQKSSGQFQLAVRCQRQEMLDSPEVEKMRQSCRGEIDVKFIGRLRRYSRKPWYQKQGRPLRMGQSCGHYTITAGTLGCFVQLRNPASDSLFILSNNHVLAAENKAKIGDAILQPGRLDGGQSPEDGVAKLTRLIRLKKKGANLVDAAIAEVNPGIITAANRLKDFGGKLAGLGPEFVEDGTLVAKQGRTTGLTRGRVTAFELDNVVMDYDVGNLRFDNQLEIEGNDTRAFSLPGDSGSIVFEAESRLAIGLLFGGSDQGGSNGRGLTYANPIHTVLDLLKIDLV